LIGPTANPWRPAEALSASVEQHLSSRPELIPPKSRVVVALSGGPDSTALLHVLTELASRYRLRLVAAHFDHGMRPGSSAEAETVSRVARSAGVPFRAGRASRPLRPSQADLRSARLDWLESVCRSEGATRVAVGHQADDQAETVLFRIMRGTDLPGLAGIPARRGRFVRPLLPFRRRQIEAWLRDRGVGWIDDPSNADVRWTRSRIRCEVIPTLELLMPDIVPSLLDLAERAAAVEETLSRMTSRLIGRAVQARGGPGPAADRVVLDRRCLNASDPELVARALRQIARVQGVELTTGGTRTGVEFISEVRSGGSVDLGGGLQVSRAFESISVGPADVTGPARGLLVPEGGAGEGTLEIGGRLYAVRWRPAERGPGPTGKIAVQVPRGHYPLTFREWRPGDRIRLRGGTRKLKKLFNDRRVPVDERGRVPVLVDSENRVLWVPGVAVATTEVGVEYERTPLELELADA
jgi:tRNA(Ile)-lysidine synthase